MVLIMFWRDDFLIHCVIINFTLFTKDSKIPFLFLFSTLLDSWDLFQLLRWLVNTLINFIEISFSLTFFCELIKFLLFILFYYFLKIMVVFLHRSMRDRGSLTPCIKFFWFVLLTETLLSCLSLLLLLVILKPWWIQCIFSLPCLWRLRRLRELEYSCYWCWYSLVNGYIGLGCEKSLQSIFFLTNWLFIAPNSYW